ncbi:MAG: methylisocitrate lyase [Rhodospirillaceae bacterium]|jgi:methylisocitrate lyase|nr:methylisocitrate lyase [Rhodospirillaceae bacterium]
MLFGTKTAAEKRSGFRKALYSGKLLQLPGAHEPIVARIVEEQGFDGIYISGGALSAAMAMPDIGLTTLTEVTQRGRQIARVTDLPALIDLDTGFGEAMNTARTIQECEELGIAGCHIEDQVSPKRCGHLDNKIILETKDMCQKIAAAANAKRDPNFLLMVRTDAKASEGIEAAIERSKAYVDAGAEAIFPEALNTPEEYEAFRAAIDVPLLANMTEFGKTPLYSKKQLEEFGYNIAIYPVSSLRLAMGAIEASFAALKEEGSLESQVGKMQTRKRLYEIIKYEEYNQFDQNLHNFELK